MSTTIQIFQDVLNAHLSVCPGRHLGEAFVFVAIASILHTFSIEPPVDEKGVALPFDVKCVEGLLSYVSQCSELHIA